MSMPASGFAKVEFLGAAPPALNGGLRRFKDWGFIRSLAFLRPIGAGVVSNELSPAVSAVGGI